MTPELQAFDSALVRCRLLLAVLAPDSGATQGERDNAQSALARLMERHGITPDTLTRNTDKRRRGLDVGTEKNIAIAAQLARWIVGDGDLRFDLEEDTRWIPQRGAKPDKEVKVWRVSVELTEREFTEWRAACAHYLPLYEDLRSNLAEQVKAAKLALKHAAAGFVNKFNIFPPDNGKDGKGKGLSLAELSAILAAMRATDGDAWTRGMRALDYSTRA